MTSAMLWRWWYLFSFRHYHQYLIICSRKIGQKCNLSLIFTENNNNNAGCCTHTVRRVNGKPQQFTHDLFGIYYGSSGQSRFLIAGTITPKRRWTTQTYTHDEELTIQSANCFLIILKRTFHSHAENAKKIEWERKKHK